MAKKPAVEEVIYINAPEITQHLDRDPNDPRNQAPTPELPSLNDDDQN